MLDFNNKNVPHRIVVKYVPASLPDIKKPYHVKAMYQPVLDISGIATKAAELNIQTSPKVIEEGLTVGLKIIEHLVAEGYRIKTPLFDLWIRCPGQYSGSEDALSEGLDLVPRLRVARRFSRYLKEKVKLEFGGIDDRTGFIGEALDEATGSSEVLTKGNLLTISGKGLKIESDAERELQAGVFFLPPTGVPIKASLIAVNHPRKLKVIIPNELASGTEYRIAVQTMSSSRGSGKLLKTMRDMRSDFKMTA